ncbi:MAG: hypothetical protein FWH29_06910 [Methanobrevibacter sp.]|nr:hypothetical protein [Methanobrevibacter sp.]
MSSNNNLKIPPRPIFIKHKTIKLAILTVNNKIYGLVYDEKHGAYRNYLLKYDEDFYKPIKDFIFKVTENDPNYTKKETINQLTKDRTKYIIKELKAAIRNKQNKGHLNEASELEQVIIKDILRKNNINEINKLFKNKNGETGTKKALKDIKEGKGTIRKLLKGYETLNEKGEIKTKLYNTLISLNPKAKKYLTIDLENHYHFAFNLDDNNTYLFDYAKQSYIKVDKRILQEFLAEKEEIRLDTINTDSIIKSTVKRINNNYNYIEFNNKLLNLKTSDYENKTLPITKNGKKYKTQRPRPFITPKRINYDILESACESFNSDESIVYTTLKQILGTENNIKDFKQRLGASIYNIGKHITIWIGSGDNGKTILLFIRKIILGSLARNTKPNQLNSEFNQELLNNIHEVIFDETKGESFKGTEDYLKKITGGGTEEETRKIQTHDIIKTRLNSHVVIGTNELPNFNLNDTGLFNRISIIELKNKFSYLTREIDNKTIFPINDNIKEEIEEDKQGLEHLIYDSLKEYMLMKDRNEIFVNKGGIENVRSFYFGNDHLINFLNVYTNLTDHKIETTTATEILSNFEQYIEDNEIGLIIDDKQIKQDIGLKLNKLYGKENIFRTDTRPILYTNIKCTYTTGTQKKYKICPDLEDYHIIDENADNIFILIKKGYNTFELLKQQVKEHNTILTALQYLKNKEYIQEHDI